MTRTQRLISSDSDGLWLLSRPPEFHFEQIWSDSAAQARFTGLQVCSLTDDDKEICRPLYDCLMIHSLTKGWSRHLTIKVTEIKICQGEVERLHVSAENFMYWDGAEMLNTSFSNSWFWRRSLQCWPAYRWPTMLWYEAESRANLTMV